MKELSYTQYPVKRDLIASAIIKFANTANAFQSIRFKEEGSSEPLLSHGHHKLLYMP